MESTKSVDHEKQDEATSKESQLDISGLSDFDLAGIVCNRYSIKKIGGELHGFNGKCYVQLDNKLLSQLVLNTFWNEQKQIRSTRKIRAIVDALHMLNFVDEKESNEWLGFENGVLNIPNWEFTPFPLPFSPPCITYTVCADYNEDFDEQVRGIEHYTPSANPYIDWLEQCSYKAALHTPVADEFFSKIADGDPDLITRIYQMIGYIIVPDTAAKSFFLLQGVPHSGKSVLGRFIEEFFTKGCVTALDISRLSGQYLPKSLKKSRLNLSMDLPDGLLAKKSVAMLKMMTGDDLTTHESKYGEAEPYRGQCKFLFSINGKLKMKGRDTAFLDRIVCIPFKNSIPPEMWDTQLRNKLEKERQAIMMKALLHYRAFVANNRIFSGSNKVSPDIELQLSPNDTIAEFVNERCYFTNVMASYTEDLYRAYLSFCVENNLEPVSTKSGFAQRLAGLFPTKITPSRWREDGKNIRGFNGILVKKDGFMDNQVNHFNKDDDYVYTYDDMEGELDPTTGQRKFLPDSVFPPDKLQN